MESSSVNGMCRCCASEGAFKDIKTSYHWMGEEEVYGDMLRECFDVNLSSADQGGICEVCITQLRNAANFKKQVLHTESQFKQHLRSKGFKGAHVKEERSAFDDDSDDNDMDNIDDEDYVPDYEVPIKTESESEEKPKKRAAKAASTRAKKSKSNDGEATVKTSLSMIAFSPKQIFDIWRTTDNKKAETARWNLVAHSIIKSVPANEYLDFKAFKTRILKLSKRIVKMYKDSSRSYKRCLHSHNDYFNKIETVLLPRKDLSVIDEYLPEPEKFNSEVTYVLNIYDNVIETMILPKKHVSANGIDYGHNETIDQQDKASTDISKIDRNFDNNPVIVKVESIKQEKE